jgi:hypothetical protein
MRGGGVVPGFGHGINGTPRVSVLVPVRFDSGLRWEWSAMVMIAYAAGGRGRPVAGLT